MSDRMDTLFGLISIAALLFLTYQIDTRQAKINTLEKKITVFEMKIMILESK